jgi:hypothetical protein
MDLGFVVPGGILAGVLLIKRKPFGYVLATVFTIKAFTMLTAMTAMMIRMSAAGVQPSISLQNKEMIILCHCYCNISHSNKEKNSLY